MSDNETPGGVGAESDEGFRTPPVTHEQVLQRAFSLSQPLTPKVGLVTGTRYLHTELDLTSKAAVGNLLATSIPLTAEALTGTAVNSAWTTESVGKLDFSEFSLPFDESERISLGYIQADLPSMRWEFIERSSIGSIAVNADIEADIEFEGYIHKSDSHRTDWLDVWIIDENWSRHFMWVSCSVREALSFYAVIDERASKVERTDFESAVPIVEQ